MFPLVEFVIICMVVGVVVAMAIPTMGRYVSIAHSAAAYSALTVAGRAVADYYAHTGTLPADNARAGLPEPERMGNVQIKSVRVVRGTINILFRNGESDQLAEMLVSFRPVVSLSRPTNPIFWVCGEGNGTAANLKCIVAKHGKH